jgi:aminopeptidase N
MFDGTVYNRGGMTLEALRERVGDAVFFRIMRHWAQQNKFKNVTTPRFIALAETELGQDLASFFDTWLYQPGKPTSW